jgi:hypothetical protein
MKNTVMPYKNTSRSRNNTRLGSLAIKRGPLTGLIVHVLIKVIDDLAPFMLFEELISVLVAAVISL